MAFDPSTAVPIDGDERKPFDPSTAVEIEEPGLLDRMGASAERLASSYRTGITGIFGSDEEARAAALKGAQEQERIARETGPIRSFGEVADIYEKEGIIPAAGEFISQVPGALAEQVPQTGGLIASSLAGGALGSVIPGVGTTVGAVTGALIYLFPQFFGSALEEQAEQDVKAGREVDLEYGKATAAAAGSSALEMAGGVATLGINTVRRAIGKEVSKDVAEKKLLETAQRSLSGTVATGAARGLVEIPVEVAQEVINRAQSGQDLLSEEAIANYGMAAYGALQAGPAMGAIASPLDRRAAVRDLEARGLTPTGEPIATPATEDRLQKLQEEQQTAEYMREIEKKELEDRQRVMGVRPTAEGQFQLNLPRGEKVAPTTTLQGTPLPAAQKGFDAFGRPIAPEVEGEAAPTFATEPTPMSEQLDATLRLDQIDTERNALNTRLAALERTKANRPEAQAIRERLAQLKTLESQIDELTLTPPKTERVKAEVPDTVLRSTDLVNAGLPKVAGYTKQLSGLDLADPTDRTKAATIIGQAMENPRVKPESKTALQALYDQKVAAAVPEGQQAFDFTAPEAEVEAARSTVVTDATFDDLGIGKNAVIRKSEELLGSDYSDPAQAAYLRNALEIYRDTPNRSEAIKEKISTFLAKLPQVETAPETTGVEDVTATTTESTTERPASEPSVGMADVGDGATTTQEDTAGGVPATELGGLADVDAGAETDVVGGEPAPGAVTADQLFNEIKALEEERYSLLTSNGKRPRTGTAKRARFDELGSLIDKEKLEWAKLDTQERKAKKEAPKKEPAPKKEAPKKKAPKVTPAKDIEYTIEGAVSKAQELAEQETPNFKELAQLARNAYNSGLLSEAKFKNITKDIAARDETVATDLYDLLLSEQSGNNIVNAVGALRANGDMAGAVTPELEAAINTGDVKGALQAIRDNDTGAFNQIEQLLVKRLLDISTIMPKLRVVDSLGTADKGNPILGQYNAVTDEISLVRGAADSHTFLHEMIHAFVHRTIIEQEQTGARKPAFKDLQDVYNHVLKERPDLADEFGMKSLTEFASEAMSNPEFQMQLMGISYRAYSVFTWFARKLRELLGIGEAGNIGNTLFSAMVAVDGLLNTGRELQVAATGTWFGENNVANVTTEAKQNADTPLGQVLPTTLAEVNRAVDQVQRTELNKYAHMVAQSEVGWATIIRQKSVDQFAPLAKKLGQAFSKGIRNGMGDINPMIALRQALDHQRISLQVFRDGGLRKLKDGTWEAFELKDSNGKPVSAQKTIELIKDFADKSNTTYKTMKGRVSTVLEGMRLKELRDYNAKLETLAREQATSGDIDAAYNTRQGKMALHMTNAEIDALVKIFNDTPEIQEIQRVMNEVRSNLIDAMVTAGRISQEQASAWRAAANYVPFDRLKEIADDPEIVFGVGRRGIAALAQLPKLRGSLERPVTNVIDGFMNKMAWMVEQSMRNAAVVNTLKAMADAGFARKLPNKNAARNTHLVLSNQYENGKVVHFEVQNENDLAAFLSTPEWDGTFIRFLSGSSRLLRTTVTATPPFALKQIFDDAQRAMFHSGVDKPIEVLGRTLYNFPRILLLKAFNKESPFVKALEQSGTVGEYDFNPINPAETIELDAKAVKRSPFRAVIHAMEQITKASDMAARLAVYEQTMKETKDSSLAHTRARELINFNRRGSSKTMRLLTRIVPFFNTWAQGNDLMYRGFTGEDSPTGKNKAAAQTMFISRMAYALMLGFVYAYLMGDDEGYKETSDEIRDRAWILPKSISDSLGMEQSFKIPVPTEFGFLFKSIPERVVQYYRDYVNKENKPAFDAVTDFMKDAVGTYGVLPIPALFKPALENAANYSSFNKRALVPPTLQNRPKELQYTSSTSEFAKWLGKETNQSPIMIDNAMRGYFGLMWSNASMLIDGLMNPNRPARNLNQLPFLSIGLMAPVGTRTKDEFYSFREKVAAAVSGKNALEGDPKRRAEFMQENAKLLAAAPYVNTKLRALQAVRDQKKVLAMPNLGLSGDERRKRLTELERLENTILSDIKKVRSYFEKK